MNLALSMTRAAVRGAAAVSPELGAAVALPLFGRVAGPRPIGAEAEATMWQAHRSSVVVDGLAGGGIDVAVYDWGRGDDVVVLAHGWDGRASQFAPLVRELVAEGYRVVAFDAPAHGATGGRGTYLIDWLDVLAALQRSYGRFRAVIGHSFGGLATLLAAADGLSVDRVATVAAPADADLLLSQFRVMLGYDERTAVAMRRRFARRYFPGEADPLARLSPVLRPLPARVGLLAMHDEGDQVVPFGELARLAGANPRARVVATRGLGHNRILASDEFLDAVVAFVGEPSAAAVASAVTAPVVMAPAMTAPAVAAPAVAAPDVRTAAAPPVSSQRTPAHARS
ncbi:alpha/beta fold hydrolase [Microbacterium sp. HJ5]